MAIPDNYIDKITKDDDSRYICPAADKVIVDNENFEGTDLDAVLDEVAESLESAGTGNVSSVTMNDTVYSPDDNGNIDLGDVSTDLSDYVTTSTMETALADKLEPSDFSVSSNEDGAVVITVGDDSYTIDLNHTHEGMVTTDDLADYVTTNSLAAVATTGSYNDLSDTPTIPTAVSQLTNDAGYTTNTGTVTGITMNGSSMGTSGVVNLGTVLTSHQSLSGYAKYVLLESESDMPASPASDTLYLIPES